MHYSHPYFHAIPNFSIVFYLTTAVINDLSKVMKAVHGVNKWFNLGLELGLLQPTLQSIRDQHQPSDHKREMLTKWLNQVDGCRPSWKVLVEALRSSTVQANAIANTIEQDHRTLS